MWKYILTVLVVLLLAAFFMRDTSQPVTAAAEIDIKAPLKAVWQLQTDIGQWQKWNADIESIQIDGPVAPGTQFVWKSGGVTIRSTIREMEAPRLVVWTGETIGIKAVHRWQFSSDGDTTHVYTEETFTGFLPWLLPGTMRDAISEALNDGVRKLKTASEKQDG